MNEITWSLQLFAGNLSKKIEQMEKKFTDASDQLEILETETQSLKEAWEGASFEEWYEKMLRCMKETRGQLKEMKMLLSRVLDSAEKLVAVEQNNRRQIEEMKV